MMSARGFPSRKDSYAFGSVTGTKAPDAQNTLRIASSSIQRMIPTNWRRAKLKTDTAKLHEGHSHRRSVSRPETGYFGYRSLFLWRSYTLAAFPTLPATLAACDPHGERVWEEASDADARRAGSANNGHHEEHQGT